MVSVAKLVTEGSRMGMREGGRLQILTWVHLHFRFAGFSLHPHSPFSLKLESFHFSCTDLIFRSPFLLPLCWILGYLVLGVGWGFWDFGIFGSGLPHQNPHLHISLCEPLIPYVVVLPSSSHALLCSPFFLSASSGCGFNSFFVLI